MYLNVVKRKLLKSTILFFLMLLDYNIAQHNPRYLGKISFNMHNIKYGFTVKQTLISAIS